MKKFIRRSSGSRDRLETTIPTVVVQPASTTDSRNDGDTIWETRIRRFEQLQEENEKLKDVTERVFYENLDLKEKLNKLIREKTTDEQQPSWRECRRLIHLVTQENDYLLSHIRREHQHLRDIKGAHLKAVQKLSQQLDDTTFEKSLLDNNYQKLKTDHEQAKIRVNVLTDEFQQSIPLSDHRKALAECQQAVKDLKLVYQAETSDLEEALKSRTGEAERLSAELQQCRCSSLEEQCRQLTTDCTLLTTQLDAAENAKQEAELTLSQLLRVVETQTRDKEQLTNDKQKLLALVRKIKRNI